jgi:hypothetical protein
MPVIHEGEKKQRENHQIADDQHPDSRFAGNMFFGLNQRVYFLAPGILTGSCRIKTGMQVVGA